MQATAKKSAGIGDAAVKRATGKDWAAWITLLDRAGARDMKHPQIARLLHTRHDLPAWWAQMVTVGYERARGMRKAHQAPGGYEINKSKTIEASCARAFAAWKEAARRKAWLAEEPLTVRKVTAGKSIRLNWIDGKTTVAVNFYSRGRGKCQVAVQHMKLPGAAAAERMKKYWATALGRLADYLEGA
jgi:uncharacterized protein YndB with AHSA1/START domain